VEEYRITNRGGKGVKTINVTGKTGSLIGLLNVNEKQDLMITCKSGVTIRTSIATIREAGRATQGVKLIRLDEGDEIAAITKLNEPDGEDEASENNITNLPEAPHQNAEPNENEISKDDENESENQ